MHSEYFWNIWNEIFKFIFWKDCSYHLDCGLLDSFDVGRKNNSNSFREIKNNLRFDITSSNIFSISIVTQEVIENYNFKTDLRLHKLTSYLSLIFFFLHVQSFGHGWTKAMLIIFILTAISAVFSKGFVKHKSRNSILRQYFFHIVMGSALIFMVLPHALIASLFE